MKPQRIVQTLITARSVKRMRLVVLMMFLSKLYWCNRIERCQQATPAGNVATEANAAEVCGGRHHT
jgi:hypothetical protein